MQSLNLLAAVVVLFLLPGCDEDVFHDCEDGYGGKVSRELQVPYFDRVQLNIAADVYISQGPELSVVAEGQQNVIDELEKDVRNQEWEIEFDECIKNYGKLDIYITMPEIREITLAGSGDIIGETVFTGSDIGLYIPGSGRIDVDVDAEHVEGRISGSGRMYLSGATSDLDFTINGSGDLNAFNLVSDRAEILISGSGDAEVNVLAFLKVRIPGSGTVFYKGSPSIDSEISGSGSLINAN